MCGVFLVALIVSACSGDPSKNYSITVEYLPIELGYQELEDSADYSSAIVSIKRVDVSESNEEVLTELTESPFRNGSVKLRGQIEQPMWVEVHVESDKSTEPLSTRTFIEPGESVSLAVIDSKNQFYNSVAHVGTLSNVQDPSKKFSLMADLNSMNFDVHYAIAFLETIFWNENGTLGWETHSFIVVQDGKFSIELEIEDPIVVSVYIAGTPSYSSVAVFIAEPGATILLEPSRHTDHASANLTTGWFQDRRNTSQLSQYEDLVVIAGTGRHARLFDSWRQSFTYRLKQEQLDDAREEDSALRNELATMKSSLEETDGGQGEESTSSLTGASWVKTDPAEGCEHIDLSQVLPDRETRWNTRGFSKEIELRDEIDSIRQTTLNDIARRARDPFDSLLALELGAFASTQQRRERIKILDKLSPRVSRTVAEERVAPSRKYSLSVIESEENEHRTVPGQKAPDFELPNLRGNSQRLSQIFNENDLVFMQFVRYSENYSISQHVASLHEMYGEVGLQIVEVLFDVDSDQQQEFVTNQDIGWIQLLDPQVSLFSEIAKSYAILHKSLDYLVDSYGCIVQRNLNEDDLHGFLKSYFDIPASTEE